MFTHMYTYITYIQYTQTHIHLSFQSTDSVRTDYVATFHFTMNFKNHEVLLKFCYEKVYFATNQQNPREKTKPALL